MEHFSPPSHFLEKVFLFHLSFDLLVCAANNYIGIDIALDGHGQKLTATVAASSPPPPIPHQVAGEVVGGGRLLEASKKHWLWTGEGEQGSSKQNTPTGTVGLELAHLLVKLNL